MARGQLSQADPQCHTSVTGSLSPSDSPSPRSAAKTAVLLLPGSLLFLPVAQFGLAPLSLLLLFQSSTVFAAGHRSTAPGQEHDKCPAVARRANVLTANKCECESVENVSQRLKQSGVRVTVGCGDTSWRVINRGADSKKEE